MPKQANKEGMTDLPMQTRAASVGTINDENRTCNLVWTTGGKVRRYDYMRGRFYVEELPVSSECVRMERLTSGRAPFLNSHCRYDLSDQLGVVESASIENGQGIATARFSKREEVNAIWQDVKEGIIRNISVGYAIHSSEMIPRKGWRRLDLSGNRLGTAGIVAGDGSSGWGRWHPKPARPATRHGHNAMTFFCT